MTDKEIILKTLRRIGKTLAEALQDGADTMTGTELYEAEDYIPSFAAACAKKNMLERPVGFVCRSTAGRLVRLLQPYDSTVFTQEPEELTAQWGFKWSADPAKALPFICIATSAYMKGDCCTYNGKVWRSGQDNNVWEPGTTGVNWELVE